MIEFFIQQSGTLERHLARFGAFLLIAMKKPMKAMRRALTGASGAVVESSL